MHHTTRNSILDMLQPLRRIHKMGVRTNGTNTERENMTHRSILSLWHPTLFAPRSATRLLASVLVSMSGLLVPARAQSATDCPPNSFPDTINLAKNPSFEKMDPHGPFTIYQRPWPLAAPSSAAEWTVHSNDAQAKVTTNLEATKVPAGTDPAGNSEGQTHMLHVIADGNESGVFQVLASPPSHLTFSAWVYVNTGLVVVQATAGNKGPAAYSTKRKQWEELRVCTDGTVPVDTLVIYNQDPKGGDFFVDRVEVRRTLQP